LIEEFIGTPVKRMIVNSIITFAFIFCSVFVEDNNSGCFLLTLSSYGDKNSIIKGGISSNRK